MGTDNRALWDWPQVYDVLSEVVESLEVSPPHDSAVLAGELRSMADWMAGEHPERTQEDQRKWLRNHTKKELVALVEYERGRAQQRLDSLRAGYDEQTATLTKARDLCGELEHALESVVDGIKQVMLHSKVYEADYNAYYALWYWIEWGTRVDKKLAAEADTLEPDGDE